MKILKILAGTVVDGPGLRTSVYISGCKHKCSGCHNPESWDFNNGKEYSIDKIVRICLNEELPVTLTGGDPLYNPEIYELVKTLNYVGINNIWLYTGFTMEYIMSNPELSKVLDYITGIVDSPFIISQRNTDLIFRGSTNQRIWIKSNDIWTDCTENFS